MPTPAHRWARRNPLIVGFLALVFWAALVGYVEDVQSCRRTQATRMAQQHNVGVLQRVLGEDASRAVAYSRVDSNAKGREINRVYAARRYVWLERLQAPDVPACFPIPGI